MKILLAVDGSSYTKRMLAYLAAHDELLSNKNEFTAITVVPPVTSEARSFATQEVLDAHYLQAAKAILDPIVAFATQKGWNIATLHPVGNAADLIGEAATEGKFDLLVMGSHGYSSIANLMLGSVGTKVLAQTKVPVLIIR
jgi:nucleotide-binding universal stress UspA family protein